MSVWLCVHVRVCLSAGRGDITSSRVWPRRHAAFPLQTVWVPHQQVCRRSGHLLALCPQWSGHAGLSVLGGGGGVHLGMRHRGGRLKMLCVRPHICVAQVGVPGGQGVLEECCRVLNTTADFFVFFGAAAHGSESDFGLWRPFAIRAVPQPLVPAETPVPGLPEWWRRHGKANISVSEFSESVNLRILRCMR